ncbi:MAG TPA: helix-turn-helix domain-containing protein [Candidatus Binataceae bacterium]|jgi:DNA-binding NarL/FixJ family response regulator|nr:helix-turn-helix domain-containing protein [Candidatus Binataceae bacterium]
MLDFFIQLIGEEATARLIERFGGTRLYVPHYPAPDDALVQTIGVEPALRLAQTFGGERVEVPKPPPRRVQILALRAAGRSVESIARTLGCTRRRVFQVLAEARRAAQAAPRSAPPSPRAPGHPR